MPHGLLEKALKSQGRKMSSNATPKADCTPREKVSTFREWRGRSPLSPRIFAISQVVGQCRSVRIRQIGKTWPRAENFLVVSAFEIFGEIYSE
jgi:hypothetical protein